MNFLKNVKNLAIVAASSNFNWLIDNRHFIKNVDKIIILTMPALQKELKKQYRGSDVYFKYIDEMAEAAQICDGVMFVNVTKDIEKEYMRIASKHNVLKYIISPKGAGYNNLVIDCPVVNGNEYEMFDLSNIMVLPEPMVITPKKDITPVVETVTPVVEVIVEAPKKIEQPVIKEEPKVEEQPKEEIKSKKPFGRGRR